MQAIKELLSINTIKVTMWNLLCWQWIPLNPSGHLQTYPMNVSPRYASLISHIPPLWHGLGRQGPERGKNKKRSIYRYIITTIIISVIYMHSLKKQNPSCRPSYFTSPLKYTFHLVQITCQNRFLWIRKNMKHVTNH